jgi:hypothetical protein
MLKAKRRPPVIVDGQVEPAMNQYYDATRLIHGGG